MFEFNRWQSKYKGSNHVITMLILASERIEVFQRQKLIVQTVGVEVRGC